MAEARCFDEGARPEGVVRSVGVVLGAGVTVRVREPGVVVVVCMNVKVTIELMRGRGRKEMGNNRH